MSDKPPRASKKARLTAARLAAVQALYQQAISGLPLAQVKSEFLAHYTGVELDGDVFVLPDEPAIVNPALAPPKLIEPVPAIPPEEKSVPPPPPPA